MSSKIAGILSKVQQERRRGDFPKALKRLDDELKKFPDDIVLYREAIDVSLEAGESLRATRYVKAAQNRVPGDGEDIWQYCLAKIESFNDPILCKSMVDIAIKKRELELASEVLEHLKDHTAEELLQRTRTKRQSFSSASNQAFRSELTANSLAEALLCVRSKRYQDAARVFVRILDDKPVEHQVLTPYLTVLQKKLPRKGGIAYALGCSLLVSEKYQKAISMIIHGISLAPTNADDAFPRIEGLKDVESVPNDSVELALAKLTIFQGGAPSAAARLRKLLENDDTKAPDVLGVLEPHVEEPGENTFLNYLYIEAALMAGDNGRAINQIKNIYQERQNHADLLAWLDSKSQEQTMTADVLSTYAELALEQQMYEKSIEVFRELISRQPHEVHRVKDLVAPHRKNAVMAEFWNQLEGPQEKRPAADDGFSIEHYGSRDFTLDNSETVAPQHSATEKTAVPPATKPTPEAMEIKRDEQPTADDSLGQTTSDVRQTDTFEREGELDLRNAGLGPSDADLDSVLDKASSPRFSRPAGIELDGYGDAFQDEQPEKERDEIRDLSRDEQRNASMSESEDEGDDDPGAAVIDEIYGQEEPEPLSEEEIEKESVVLDEEQAPWLPNGPDVANDSPAEESPTVILLGGSETPGNELSDEQDRENVVDDNRSDYRKRYQSFKNGDLNNDEIIELIEEAARLGHMRHMKDLLTFIPENVAQETKRKYYLAEYYLHDDQPVAALVILRTVNINGLGKEERKAFLLKNAFCYQQLNRFEAAQSVYLRMASEFPDFEAAEHMAKLNYERHLETSASGALALEKISSLQTADTEEEE